MLTVHIFNVGQGDSILLEFPDGEWGVVDCGGVAMASPPPALTYLRSRNVERLAFVCLTHPHADHFSGLPEILEHYQDNIDEYWIFRIDSAHWRKFLKVQEYAATTPSKRTQYNALLSIFKVIAPKFGQGRVRFLDGNMNLLSFGGVQMDCIAPLPKEVGTYLSSLSRWSLHPEEYRADENRLSAVIRLKYGESTIILGSDARSDSWLDIVREAKKRSQTLLANLVKVSHHGSNEGFYNQAWLQLIQRHSTHGAISAGAGYGHPHRQVIMSLYKLGVRLHCTNYAPHCLQNGQLDFTKFEGVGGPLKLHLFMLDQATNARTIPCNGDLHFEVEDNGTMRTNHQYAGFCPFHLLPA